jgi:hypothetical protein
MSRWISDEDWRGQGFQVVMDRLVSFLQEFCGLLPL